MDYKKELMITLGFIYYDFSRSLLDVNTQDEKFIKDFIMYVYFSYFLCLFRMLIFLQKNNFLQKYIKYT